MKPLQIFLAAVAVLFGLMTLFAGGKVLLGSDPGYTVYQPLLIYNTTMGLIYIATGLLIGRSLPEGKSASLTVFVLNLMVLVAIYFLHTQNQVATESLKAMSMRTGVWFVLFVALAVMGRRSRS